MHVHVLDFLKCKVIYSISVSVPEPISISGHRSCSTETAQNSNLQVAVPYKKPSQKVPIEPYACPQTTYAQLLSLNCRSLKISTISLKQKAQSCLVSCIHGSKSLPSILYSSNCPVAEPVHSFHSVVSCTNFFKFTS